MASKHCSFISPDTDERKLQNNPDDGWLQAECPQEKENKVIYYLTFLCENLCLKTLHQTLENVGMQS